MGGLTSAVTALAGFAQPYYADTVSARQQKDMDKLQLRQAQASADLQKQQIGLQAAQNESERRNALKRAVARQKANFGSQGIGSSGGSSEAVLLGLFNESADESANRAKLDSLRSNIIDQGVAQSRQINLLQQSQLQEKQRLKWISDLV